MMPASRLTPSLAYFGSQAEHAISNISSGLNSAFDRIRAAINSLGTNLRSAGYGLRQEVPFERWFYNNGFEAPLSNPFDLIKAHVWAVFAACEGAVRLGAEAVSYAYSLVFARQNCSRHQDVLKAQLIGLSLSALAIYAPNAAKERAHNGGQPIIGSSLINWQWGSLYTGTMDLPFWKLESNQYSWAPVPTP